MKRSPFDARWFDSALLALLVVVMCGQIDPFTLGKDTFASEGYATKQLKVALCDIVLFLVFVWFVGRTAQIRGRLKATLRGAGGSTGFQLWWPPLPCWALLLALFVSVAHSPRFVESLMGYFHPAAEMTKEAHKRLLQAPKEAVAEVVQMAGYFLIAPWLFVNLIHDRREGTLISRRRLALWAFVVGVGLNFLVALIQYGKNQVPRGLWGSANLYGSFLALVVPLIWARAISGEVVKLRFARERARGLVIGLCAAIGSLLTIVTPFAAIGLGFGMALTSLLRASTRGLALAIVLIICAGLSWRALCSAEVYQTRVGYFSPKETEGKGKGEVRKQWIEWYVAQGWSKPGVESAFATGVGPGNYQLNIGTYYVALPNTKKMPLDSNNFYLVQGVSLGVVGLAAILWVISYFAGQARLSIGTVRDDWLGAGVFASLAVWLVVSVFHALLVRGLGLVLAFLLALAIVARLTQGTGAVAGESDTIM